jgi:uncharacterized protein
MNINEWVDHIPVVWLEPSEPPDQTRVVLWLTGLAGTKERELAHLEELAENGFVAISFDPWQHGARGRETREEIGQRVFGHFRRNMWPILGQTTLDTLRVIDWATQKFGVSTVSMGGISMGGDIAVAAAGLDPRITAVAAIIATPDWLRPGMRTLGDAPQLMDPGTADAYAQFFYDRLNPITHLDAYAHRPSITFECGAEDQHVPPDGALRFQAALADTYQATPDRLRVNLHKGAGHGVAPAMWDSSLAWLIYA